MREQEVKVKETEAITIKNSEEEDKLENKISRLREEFKLGILIQFLPILGQVSVLILIYSGSKRISFIESI